MSSIHHTARSVSSTVRSWCDYGAPWSAQLAHGECVLPWPATNRIPLSGAPSSPNTARSGSACRTVTSWSATPTSSIGRGRTHSCSTTRMCRPVPRTRRSATMARWSASSGRTLQSGQRATESEAPTSYTSARVCQSGLSFNLRRETLTKRRSHQNRTHGWCARSWGAWADCVSCLQSGRLEIFWGQ